MTFNNKQIIANGRTKEELLHYLEGYLGKTKIKAWSIQKSNEQVRPDHLVLYWSQPKNLPANIISAPLLYDHSPEDVCNLIWNWLINVATYPEEPDHDGSNNKGWLLQSDRWGKVEGYGLYSILCVEPEWCMYGK